MLCLYITLELMAALVIQLLMKVLFIATPSGLFCELFHHSDISIVNSIKMSYMLCNILLHNLILATFRRLIKPLVNNQ